MLTYLKLPFKILKNKLGIISYPSFVTFIISWRCNAKCIMCDIWKRTSGYEINLEEINSIFSQLGNLDAVRITGGEPYVRNDLPDIINIIQSRNSPHIVHITTNGLLKDKILGSFAKINNTKNIHIKLSINAFGQEHDKIIGIDGAFEMALDTLKALVEIKDKYRFFIGVNQTIASKKSMEGYERLKKICDDYKVDLFPVLAYAKTALYADEQDLELFPHDKGDLNIFADFSKDELKDILKKLLHDNRKTKNFIERTIKRYYLAGTYNRLILGKALPSPKCIALNDHLRILPNADVPICLYNSHIVGNLLKQSFKELWFGEEMKEYRKKVKSCPVCWAECEIGPNSVYTGDIVKSIFG